MLSPRLPAGLAFIRDYNYNTQDAVCPWVNARLIAVLVDTLAEGNICAVSD
jgi:hypothetical protein